MKTLSRHFNWIFYITLIYSLMFLFSCEHNTPVAPEDSAKQVTILSLKSSAMGGLKKPVISESLVDNYGGSIWIGDTEGGYSGLIIPEDAFDDTNVQIQFYWQSEGLLQADCYPEGIAFKQPVYIRLSYKEANLMGVDENRLGIYYLNEEYGAWELVSDNVNTLQKYVDGYITHFSRYAIGME